MIDDASLNMAQIDQKVGDFVEGSDQSLLCRESTLWHCVSVLKSVLFIFNMFSGGLCVNCKVCYNQHNGYGKIREDK